MGLPSIGLFLFACNLDAPAVLTFSVLLLGLSYGAEGDLVCYLVVRTSGRSIQRGSCAVEFV
jgi:hypothetical protein